MTVVRRPGQPLTALTLLVGGWILARVALWQAPFPLGEALAMPDLAERSTTSRASSAAARDGKPSEAIPLWSYPPLARHSSVDSASRVEPGPNPTAPRVRAETFPFGLAARVREPSVRTAAAGAVDVGRPSPAVAMPRSIEAPGPGITPLARWSGDGWLLFRAGAAGSLAARPESGRYGGSQAGTVLRYRLASGEHRPTIYARTSAALASETERELALGAAVRPLASVPVRAQLELRAVQVGGRLRLRPAAFAVSELRPLELPGQVRAQAYLQAGYVAGDFATPFVGGDVRIDRRVADLGEARVRVGAGAWGGAQKDAAALDVGPGATLETRLGGVPATLALDYRLRVAGAAEPRSGFALTLTTGF